MTDLAGTLRHCEAWIERHGSQARPVGEQNTKAGLIEPILETLGWDVSDPDEVHREYRRLPSDNPVDYALLLVGTPRVLVEAKGVTENLDDPRWANQTVAYATAAGVNWVVLTNGKEWRIFNAHAPVPLERKLFRTVRLGERSDTTLPVLGLLSKDSIEANRIEGFWTTHFADQAVSEALSDLFDRKGPSREIVAAVRRRTPELELKDVRRSLARVRATFDFADGSVGAVSAAGRAVPGRSVGRQPATSERAARPEPGGKVSEAERNLTLPDLIQRGLLSPGATLEASIRGQRADATLRSDGWVVYEDVAYRALSGAGAAVKETWAGRSLSPAERSTDGWQFWRARDPDGALVTLKELRRRAAL